MGFSAGEMQKNVKRGTLPRVLAAAILIIIRKEIENCRIREQEQRNQGRIGKSHEAWAQATALEYELKRAMRWLGLKAA